MKAYFSDSGGTRPSSLIAAKSISKTSSVFRYHDGNRFPHCLASHSVEQLSEKPSQFCGPNAILIPITPEPLHLGCRVVPMDQHVMWQGTHVSGHSHPQTGEGAWGPCWFLAVMVTNCHKLGGLKQQTLTLLVLKSEAQGQFPRG